MCLGQASPISSAWHNSANYIVRTILLLLRHRLVLLAKDVIEESNSGTAEDSVKDMEAMRILDKRTAGSEDGHVRREDLIQKTAQRTGLLNAATAEENTPPGGSLRSFGKRTEVIVSSLTGYELSLKLGRPGLSPAGEKIPDDKKAGPADMESQFLLAAKVSGSIPPLKPRGICTQCESQ